MSYITKSCTFYCNGSRFSSQVQILKNRRFFSMQILQHALDLELSRQLRKNYNHFYLASLNRPEG